MTQAQPIISVVIPTFNRALLLERCLESFSKQTFPHDNFEVLVVDDGSSDQTRALLQQKYFSFKLSPLFCEHGGAAKARNRGIAEARGSIVLFTDDDCLPAPDFLKEHCKAHQKSGNLVVRGPILVVRTFQEIFYKTPSFFSLSMNFFCTSNASIERSILVELGGFDESFPRWEDAELAFRLRKRGLKMSFVMKAMVHHLKPARHLADLVRTALADGKSARQLYRRHPSFRTWMSTGQHPLSLLSARLLKRWVAVKLARMNPQQPVHGFWEKLIFHHFFIEGFTNHGSADA